MRPAVGVLSVAALLSIAVPVVVLAVPDTVRIPKTRPHPPGTPQDEALFSHWSHGQQRCYSCHPSLFPQAPLAFAHADMNRGKFCGACHRAGGQAPAVQSYTCDRCHVPR
jgi:c(7)-type cytochrome triheme protein